MLAKDPNQATTEVSIQLPQKLTKAVEAVYRYLLVLTCDINEAEDLLQQVFLKVIRRQEIMSMTRVTAAGRAYYLAVARNEFFQQKRRRKIHAKALEGSSLLLSPSGNPGPFQQLQTRENAQRVQDALFGLQVKHREVVQLHVFEDMGFEEISRTTGEARTTLVSRYQAALKVLKEKLNDF
ncbi:RNA polymerase sigma factor [Planctomycetota bacterium]